MEVEDAVAKVEKVLDRNSNVNFNAPASYRVPRLAEWGPNWYDFPNRAKIRPWLMKSCNRLHLHPLVIAGYLYVTEEDDMQVRNTQQTNNKRQEAARYPFGN
jgi:hypothetical protein